MFRDKVYVVGRCQQFMNGSSHKCAHADVHSPFVEWIQSQQEPIQRVDDGRCQLTAVVGCVHRSSISFAAHEDVEEALKPRVAAHPDERLAYNVRDVWKVVVMKCVIYVQDHPMRRVFIVIIQGEKKTVQFPSRRVVALQFFMQLSYAFVRIHVI